MASSSGSPSGPPPEPSTIDSKPKPPDVSEETKEQPAITTEDDSPPFTSKTPGRPSVPRPGLPERTDTAQSRYVQMLLSVDDIPKFHNMLAAFFVWLLLAGFLVFPGTFTSLQETIEEDSHVDSAGEAILHTVQNLPLLIIASVACGLAALGMIALAYVHGGNYVWLLNRLFLPGLGNSFAGIISTLVAVYTQKGGEWSIMAKVTAIVEGACLLVCGVLFLVFQKWLLKRVKKLHGTFYENQQKEHEGEGIKDKVERIVKEPGLQPGSVV